MDEQIVKQRYLETSKAITEWLKGQKGKGTPDDALGIGKAFLTHAAMAVAMHIPDTEKHDADQLYIGFMGVVRQWMEDKRDRLTPE